MAYHRRLIDDELDELFTELPAIAIDGAKGVGKTSTAEERAAVGAWATLREWLFVQLPKPAYASALLLVTAVAGIATANVRADHAREQYRLDSARQYLASIDPIAMNASAARLSR